MDKNEIVKLRVMQVDDKDVPAKYVEAFNSYLDKVVIPHFEKQLTEKDKEIMSLQESLDWERKDKTVIVKQLDDPNAYVSLEDYKNSSHQICEKIREKLMKYAIQHPNKDYSVITIVDNRLDFLIDQIEKGE